MKYSQFKEMYEEKLSTTVGFIKEYKWENKQSYAAWLANTHYYVNFSSLHLARCSSVMTEENKQHTNRFIKHAIEELGHEHQLEKDVSFLGYKLEDVDICYNMKMLHRSLFYWSAFSDKAIGFLGWVVLIEGLAVEVGPLIYSRVSEAHGTKPTCFLRSHSDEDPDHIEKAFQLIKSLSDEQRSVVFESFDMYNESYQNFIKEISMAEISEKSSAA